MPLLIRSGSGICWTIRLEDRKKYGRDRKNCILYHKVPEQVSVTGFDDSIYARMVRPRLTTVHQDVGQKAHLAFSRLLRMVAGEQLKEFNIKSPVYLVKRDSVKI